MNTQFYYGLKKREQPSFRSQVIWLGGSILTILIGLGFMLKDDTEVLFILRFPFGLLYFIVGIIALLSFFIHLNKRYRYFLINNHNIEWRLGLLNRPTIIKLVNVVNYTSNDDHIQFFIRPGKTFSFPKARMRSSKKRKELDRVLSNLFPKK